MPIYEYRCETCKEWVEEHFFPSIPRNVPDVIESACPVCGETGGTFKKIISSTNFHLKGTCWAKDGYDAPKMDGVRVKSIAPPGHPENTKF